MKPEYNGWENYQTWNVALWLQNDETLYELALKYPRYEKLKIRLPLPWTPDGVLYRDPNINTDEINVMLAELSD